MQKLQVGIGSKKWLCTGEAAFPLQACGLNFVEGDARTNEKTAAKKAMCVILYSLGKASFNMLAHIFDSWPSLVYRWIMEAGAKLPESNVSGEVRQMEFGEMWHFIRQKKRKLWVIKAVDRSTRRTVAWVLGNRDTSTFMRLYQKVKHLNNCLFYTDQWEVFKKVLPPERHIIGKEHPRCIERDNSNTRHHLARFTRRTKVVSKSERAVELTLRLWQAFTAPHFFEKMQTVALSIYK